MPVERVTIANWETYRKFEIQKEMKRDAIILGYREGRQAQGIVVMEKGNLDYTISLLWVELKFRRKQIGNRLLSEAILFARKQKANTLTISYDAQGKCAYMLDSMLIKAGFMIETEKIPYFDMTREEMCQSSVFKKYSTLSKKSSSIVSLGMLSTKQLYDMKKRCEERENYILSRMDLMSLDAKKSKVLLVNDEVSGMVFLKRGAVWGSYELVFASIEDTQPVRGMALMFEVSKMLFDEGTDIERLYFNCVNEKSFLMAKKLFPEQKPMWHSITHGVLEFDLLRYGRVK